MSDWPRCYFLDEELHWLLVVRPDEIGYRFLVARDGWLLLEARFEVSSDVQYETFIEHVLVDLRTESFHRRFHEVAKTYAPGMPTYQDCPGDCPWTCTPGNLWEKCFEDWAWRVPAELRAAGCRVFLHDDSMKAEAKVS